MTEKQKQAIEILNNLKWNTAIKEDDYFLLLEFVVVGDNKPQITYIPFAPTDPQPLDPVYGKFGKVTCGQYSIETTLTEKEEKQ